MIEGKGSRELPFRLAWLSLQNIVPNLYQTSIYGNFFIKCEGVIKNPAPKQPG
jgi:hypothetical protein